jgi:hypothetical protein
MKIISVPYWEWDELASYSSRRKQEYLLCKLSLGSVITEKIINLNVPAKEEDEEDEKEERNGAEVCKRSRTAKMLADVKEEEEERIGAFIYKKSRTAKMLADVISSSSHPSSI